MALLNFSKTYSEVSSYLTLAEATTGDYVKLVFTKDGHIITHGVDYTPTFAGGARGLVPTSDGTSTKFLRGNGSWAAITTSDLPIASTLSQAIANPTTTILNTQQVISYISDAFAANDAMRFKGSVSSTSFPTSCEVGDTYRVSTAGTYAGQKCEVGDLLICIKDGTAGTTITTSDYWIVIQSNINGYVTNHINNTAILLYSPNTTTFDIFAPTTGGTSGQLLVSNGSTATPTWVNQSSITAGKVSQSLSAGTGLSMSAAYNGSAAQTISLKAATATTLGGVIVDNVNTNKTISVNSNGAIYLTKTNVINALGYDPVTDNSWRPITIGGTDIGTKTLNFVPTGDIYIKTDSTDDDIQDISFGLSWYNISTKSYETA